MTRKSRVASHDERTIHPSVCDLSVDELVALTTGIRLLFENKQKLYRRLLYSQLHTLAQSAGFASVQAFVADQQAKRSTGGKALKLPPKYRNSQDAGQTWSGRGRQPKWVRMHLNNGGRLEELAINCCAEPPLRAMHPAS
ncbi:MAG: H-NS histone family protein [Magnetococcus sp. YQC-3]